MKSSRPEFSNWFDYGVDFNSRTIYLYDEKNGNEISCISATQVIQALIALNWKGKDPITLMINSPGGDLYQGNALYDAIKASESPVVGIVIGHAMSAAATIFQACDKRLMTPNSRLLFHHGTWGVHDHVRNFKAWAAEAASWEKWDEELLLARMREKDPKKTAKDVKKFIQGDAILTPQQSVDLGLADAIMKVR